MWFFVRREGGAVSDIVVRLHTLCVKLDVECPLCDRGVPLQEPTWQ